LLVGGEGTRLRPLTLTTPKPMLPVAGVPITVHQITRARAAGITRIILGTAYRSEVFAERLGDGAHLGVEIVYAHEEQPLGTGGAIRNAARFLESDPGDPVVVFNGDVLTGVDVSMLMQRHVEADAAVSLYLTRVADPRRYGLVPTSAEGWVTDFKEKPQTLEEIVTDQINAGCYVFRRDVIDGIPEDRVVSVEREIFPQLLRDGARLLGIVDDSYWLDLGTPWDYVRGSCDLVLGVAPGSGQPPADSLVLDGAVVAEDAVVDEGTTVGAGAHVYAQAQVHGSVLLGGAVIGERARVTGSAIGRRARIGDDCVITDAVVGDDAVIAAGAVVAAGVRIDPGDHHA
jgi:mannose-1-phosphate guanylyltransferase